MAQRRKGSISGPIIYGSTSVVLTVALLVGWIYVILKNYELTQGWIDGNLWLLVGGIASLIAIMTVLIIFSVFLARQILENRRQSTFVDSVTHELRSPLASLRLGLETMGRYGLSEEQLEQIRSRMLNDVERLSAFIDDILVATRIEHGRGMIGVGSVNLHDLCSRSAQAAARRHEVAPDRIEIDIAPDLEISSDATALEVIVKNLLDNAVKYSTDPVDVRVRAVRLSNGHVQLDVTDHGVGIPRHQLHRVFDRFYRVEDESVRARRGTGLGLYVVRALVVNLRGKLTAQSAGLGKGTRMTVVLPSSIQ